MLLRFLCLLWLFVCFFVCVLFFLCVVVLFVVCSFIGLFLVCCYLFCFVFLCVCYGFVCFILFPKFSPAGTSTNSGLVKKIGSDNI